MLKENLVENPPKITINFHGEIRGNLFQNFSVIKKDTREIVPNLSNNPEKYLGKIFIGNAFGTCFSVGKNHFLTAKHVVKNLVNFSDTIVIQGLHQQCGGSKPQENKINKFSTLKILKHDYKDMALIHVQENTSNISEPKAFEEKKYDNDIISISGYSKDILGFQCPNTVFVGEGALQKFTTKDNHDFYYHNSDTDNGTSGAPISLKGNIIGMHTGFSSETLLNKGIFFSKNDIEWIKNNV